MSDNQTPFQPPPEWYEQMSHTVKTIAKQQETFMDLLKGNPLNRPQDQGLLGDINDLQKDVKTLKTWKDRLVWMAVGAGAFGGSGLTFFLTKIVKP